MVPGHVRPGFRTSSCQQQFATTLQAFPCCVVWYYFLDRLLAIGFGRQQLFFPEVPGEHRCIAAVRVGSKHYPVSASFRS